MSSGQRTAEGVRGSSSMYCRHTLTQWISLGNQDSLIDHPTVFNYRLLYMAHRKNLIFTTTVWPRTYLDDIVAQYVTRNLFVRCFGLVSMHCEKPVCARGKAARCVVDVNSTVCFQHVAHFQCHFVYLKVVLTTTDSLAQQINTGWCSRVPVNTPPPPFPPKWLLLCWVSGSRLLRRDNANRLCVEAVNQCKGTPRGPFAHIGLPLCTPSNDSNSCRIAVPSHRS
eukprot:4201597-Amphidinium_carterae.1